MRTRFAGPGGVGSGTAFDSARANTLRYVRSVELAPVFARPGILLTCSFGATPRED
ncbi:hypothetical protein JCM33774_28740 [Actinophytocola sp. KF-1]